MKILHLLYAHTIGGAEKYLYYLLPHMAEEGIECHLFIVTTPGSKELFSSYRDKFTSAGVKTAFAVSTRSGFVRTAKAVTEYMRENDISYLHSHLSNSDLIAVLAKRLFNKNIRIISTRHGYHENILRLIPAVKNTKKLKKLARKSSYYYISKWMLGHIDHNYAVSKALAKLYFDLGLTKTEIPFIHHGVEVETDAQDGNSGLYRIADRQLIIVGRLEEFKGHFYLISAMKKVAEKFPDVRLLVIGEGSQKENLMNQVASSGLGQQILFMGFKEDPYSFVRHSDVIILPSLFEPFGLVYIEAFALGTPVLAFDTAAGNELIENNKTGILVPARDSDALAEKLIHLLENPEVGRQVASLAKEKYDVYFSTARMVKETAGYYRAVFKSDMAG